MKLSEILESGVVSKEGLKEIEKLEELKKDLEQQKANAKSLYAFSLVVCGNDTWFKKEFYSKKELDEALKEEIHTLKAKIDNYKSVSKETNEKLANKHNELNNECNILAKVNTELEEELYRLKEDHNNKPWYKRIKKI